MDTKNIKTGPLLAFIVKIATSFILYFSLVNIRNSTDFYSYNDVVSRVNDSYFYKTVYFFMNFTEGEFYGGIFTTLFLIIGACLAWFLYTKEFKMARIWYYCRFGNMALGIGVPGAVIISDGLCV